MTQDDSNEILAEENVSENELDAIMEELESMQAEDAGEPAVNEALEPANAESGELEATANKPSAEPELEPEPRSEPMASEASKPTPAPESNNRAQPKPAPKPVQNAQAEVHRLQTTPTPQPQAAVPSPVPAGEQSLSMTVTGKLKLTLGFANGNNHLQIECTEDALICRLNNGAEVRIPVVGTLAQSLTKSA